MAIDSRDKRFSLLGFGHPWVKLVLPNPDGTFSAANRAHFEGLYAGINLLPAPEVVRWSEEKLVGRFWVEEVGPELQKEYVGIGYWKEGYVEGGSVTRQWLEEQQADALKRWNEEEEL